jgi:hypothetical protein
MRRTNRSHRSAVVAMLLGIAACRDDASDANADGGSDAGTQGSSDDGADTSGGTGQDGVEIAPLSPSDRLVRISMALRGRRPALDELDAVEADPAALDAIVDTYLDDPRFGETIRDLHNEALLVLVDYFIYPAGFPPLGPAADHDIYALNRAVTEAPLRLIEHVVMNDRPYDEIVTAEYTVADDQVAAVWGLPAGEPGEWTETAWDDGRGNAGILSDSWLYQRHGSTPSNANRGRANAISRALLCYDFADRDIVLDSDIDLSDPEAVAHAVSANQACASCHQGLDPLASFFQDYFPQFLPAEIVEVAVSEDDQAYPLPSFYPGIFTDLLDVPMRDRAFFGAPGDDLPALGRLIADDPRFSACAARRFVAYFHQIDPSDVPQDQEAEFQSVLLDSGMDAKALAKAIVLDDRFAASHVVLGEDDDPAAPGPADDVVGVKKARPVQLGQLFEDLTGFRWRTDLGIVDPVDLPYGLGHVDLMDDSFLGYAVLAGGLDSVYVTRPSHTYSASTSLVLRTLAQLAAGAVVEADLAAAPGSRRLLGLVEATTTDEATIRDQIVALHRRLYGARIEPDGIDADDGWALWSGALAHGGDPVRAWTITLTAMLQDLRIAYY